MAWKFLTKGFGGLCTIFGKQVLMTEYSLIRNQNFLKSQGITGGHYYSSMYQKLQDGMIKDWSTMELSVGFEGTKEIVNAIISYIAGNKNITESSTSTTYSVKIEEKNYQYTKTFSKARLTSFSMSASEGGLLRCNASFLVIENVFSIDSLVYNSAAESSSFTGSKDVVAYWGTKMELGDFGGQCVDWSFEWNQPYELKFILSNSSASTGAVEPLKVLWSLPSVKFSMTSIYGESSFSSASSSTTDVILKIKLLNEQVLNCDKCSVETYSPIIGDKGNYLGYTLSGFGSGKITKNGDENENKNW